MPPHVRDGVVRGQRIQAYPTVQRFCACYECLEYWTIDRGSNSPVRGQYLGHEEWKRHHSRSLKTGIAHERLSRTPDNPLVPPPLFGQSTHHRHPPHKTYLFPITPSTFHQADLQPAPPIITNQPTSTTPKSTHSIPEIKPTRPSSNKAQRKVVSNLIKFDSFKARLEGIQKALKVSQVTDIVDTIKGNSLVFIHVPTEHLSAPASYDLDGTVAKNSTIIAHKEWLSQTLDFIKTNIHKEQRDSHSRLLAKTLIMQVEKDLAHLEKAILREWQRQRESLSTVQLDTSTYTSRPFFGFEPITLLNYLLIVVVHLLCGVSLDHCNFLLAGIRLNLHLVLSTNTNLEANSIKAALPRDTRTVLDRMKLDPVYKSFVCCPKCFFTYDADQPYPEHCVNRDPSGASECGRALRKKKRRGSVEINVPTREYLQQDFRHWLGWMYSRPEIEKALSGKPGPPNEEMSDIWDGTMLRELRGPDGKPFMNGPINEERLVFSLNMDGFNPLQNKHAGKNIQTGGIYMVCLNLPPALRHKVENMFLVGVIPGPSSPSLHEINHILRPLVTDLLDLWLQGVYLTRTSLHQHGRRVRVALGPLVCDLPAARQMAGFGSFGSTHFCSECMQTLENMNDLNRESWKARNLSDHRAFADAWKAATTSEERTKEFNKAGVRWSELLRLPYWDITKFTVVDSMHCFYLGLFRRHILEVWGMSSGFADGDGITFDHKNMPGEDEMKYGRETLRNGSATSLQGLRHNILVELCRESGLRYGGTRAQLSKRLLAYRIKEGWFDINNKPTRAPEVTPEALPFSPPSVPPNPTPQGPPNPPETHKNTTPEGEKRNMKKQPLTEEERATIATSLYQTANKSTMQKTTKPVLATICCLFVQGGPKRTYDEYVKLSADALRSIIENSRKKNGIINEKGKIIKAHQPKPPKMPKASKPKKTPQTRVLGSETLAEIRRDMRNMRLPSWISRATMHPGETKYGKYHADQWQAFCTINLLVTLVRLWGPKPKESREYRMLENFMHLVTAVKLATARKISASQITQYEYHIHQYLSTLLDLFPGTGIGPYQHLALHFGDQLRRFGPTHSWRCFAFERYNYLFQKIPTNNIHGEMEKTLFKRFCMGQKLRALFNAHEIPPTLHTIIDEFEDTFQADIRGTFLNDDLAFNDMFQKEHQKKTWNVTDETSLPKDILVLLQTWIDKNDSRRPKCTYPLSAYMRTKVGRLGQLFHTPRTSIGDSNIVFNNSGDSWSAGVISAIFSHIRYWADGSNRADTFMIVNEYTPLSSSDAVFDHFREFAPSGQLFYQDFKMEKVLVNIDDIVCHFGSSEQEVAGITSPCVHALPLDRVRPQLRYTNSQKN